MTTHPLDLAASDLSAQTIFRGRIAVLAIRGWYDRWLQRRALEELDDHLLEDIGLTRSEADREIAKPFWR